MNDFMYELAVAEIHRKPNVNMFHLGSGGFLPWRSLWKKFSYVCFLTKQLYLCVRIWILLPQ